MYKCTSCGAMQDTEGACVQCGSATESATGSDESSSAPAESGSMESGEETM